jgi:hypothetical protein
MSFDINLQERIGRELSGMFPNAEKRVRVWADVDKYRWKEEETIWNQKRGISSGNYEVYFDKEFVCFADDGRGLQEAWKTFIEKFRDLYKLGKIFVHEEMYKVKEAEEDARIEKTKIAEIPTASTPEEKIVAEVIIRAAKKKGKKVVRV